MQAIRERLGLDFLKPASQAPETAEGEGARRSASRAAAASEYLEDALLTLAPKALKVLAASPGRRSTVFELVDHLREPVSALNPVLAHLRERGYVNLIREDLKGNHEIEITDRGMRVVG